MVAQPGGPSRPPNSIEDFLWNLHTVLIAGPSPLAVDTLKDNYSKQCGHKCAIERWLVVGDGGLAATFKRIPHIVSLFQANGTTCAKATLPASTTKEKLIDADQDFRRELTKKNLAAKAKSAAPAGAPPASAPKVASKAPPPADAGAAPAANGSDVGKKPGGPTRPPATIEDFLWNMHCVLEAVDGPLPMDDLKDAYSKHLGHKCAIERFLVVGDVGLAGTLKRIPHVVTVTVANGQTSLTPTLPIGSNREALVQADQDYRKTLSAKNAAAKAVTGKAPPPATGAKPAPPAAPAAAAAGQTRPAEGGGEPDAKKQKTADSDTLSRMLVQGVVRVLQHRAKEGKGLLQVNDLAEEFKSLWKVPFNLNSAGYEDVHTFLKAWPNKVELSPEGDIVSLAKKAAEKAKAEPEAKAPPPAAKPAAPAAAEVPATAKKAAPAAPSATKAAPPAAPAAATATTTDATAAEGDDKKAKTADQDTLSRMLVQGVVRVLQSRAKESKGELLVKDLAEEFKTVWKVPFNLASAGYSDVNTFLKAWPNKVEVSTSANGDVVSLAKKAAEKAKAEPAKAPVTAAKSGMPTSAASVPSLPKPAAPAASAASAVAPASDIDAPIPSSAPEIRKELARTAEQIESLAKRQRTLMEALDRIS
jgi:hypothetical protein